MTGVRPSDGWVHALLARAAAAVAAANRVIRGLILAAAVICGDETPLRAGPGPKSRKTYLQVACTNLLTCYFLGDRTLASFKGFVYSDLHSTVVVHDRYVNYDHFPGIVHQLCCAHLLRDLEDAAQTYPDATWPVQAADNLRGLIHQASLARDAGLPAVPDDTTAQHKRLFRHAVCGIAGLSALSAAKTPPALPLLECLRDREADVLRFLTDTAIPPTPDNARRSGPVTVTFSWRSADLAQRTAWPVRAVAVIGRALRRGLAACGFGRADLAAAPRLEGSRPAGRGRPPAPESASCPRSRPALAWPSADSGNTPMRSRFRV